MAINQALFRSDFDDWGTPVELFNQLDQEFGRMTLDVCALPRNAKCAIYYSPAEDGLNQAWPGICWLNPPYGRVIPQWLAKAVHEVERRNAARVVALLPARTDTAWWHELVMAQASFIRFLKGRVRFEREKSGGPAPFPSAVVVFDRFSHHRRKAHHIVLGA